MRDVTPPQGAERRTLGDVCVPPLGAAVVASYEVTLDSKLAAALRKQTDPRSTLVRAWTVAVEGLTGEPSTASGDSSGNDGVWCFDGAAAPAALLVWRAARLPTGAGDMPALRMRWCNACRRLFLRVASV